ncbi:MAG: helix-turn-helix domain-containing protein [archaeon]
MSELIALLKRTGLNEYESKAYSSLLSLNTGTASDVSKKAGIPRARVYDVLIGLEKKGFVLVNPSRPIRFRALTPSRALENLCNTRKKECDENTKELRELAGTISSKLGPVGETEEETDKTWLLKGRNKIYSIIREQLNSVKESVIISTNETNALQKIDAFKHKLKQLSRKGIKVNFNVHSANKNAIPLKELKEIAKINFSELNSRFIVFDKNAVLLFLNHSVPNEESERAVLIESPFIANYFHKK